MGAFFESIEDVAIDVPSAPRVVCSFLIHGVILNYFSWDLISALAAQHMSQARILF
jgi:hypothetical protein